MKILIGEISSYKAVVIAKHIKTVYNDVYLIGYDKKRVVSFFHTKYIDSYVHIKYGDNIDSYIKNISSVVLSNKIDVFIPVHSDYIGEIIKNKHLFGASLKYYGNFSDYEILHLKNKLHELASDVGIRMPHQYRSVTEAIVPFVVKPTFLSSAKGVCYCKSINQQQQFINRYHNLQDKNIVIEEYIEGAGCGYEMYCENGKIVTSYSHIRLAEFPISGGSSVYRKYYYHPDMQDIACKILQRVKWTGFLMLEFKITKSGELVLIEANPRIWGSINQALSNGCWLFDSIVKKKSNMPVENPNLNTYLSPHIFVAMIGYLFHGDISVFSEFFNNLKNNKADISLTGDIRGLLSTFMRKIF